MSSQADIDLVHATARETYGRAVWTHKVHEVERERFTKKSGWLSFANIVVAAATTGFAVGAPYMEHFHGILLTALSAAVNVCLVVAQASLNYPEKEGQQRTAAKELLCLRDELQLLIMNCQMSDADPAVLRKSLECITRELGRAYKFVPNTSQGANSETGKRLHAREMTFSDAEIDSFLPVKLRSKAYQAKLNPACSGGELPPATTSPS
jgi:SMODS and SLOG-associating 2TM effector domain family 4